jgi:hypothetical protein
VTAACFFSAGGPWVAASARHSLRPLIARVIVSQSSGADGVARRRTCIPQLVLEIRSGIYSGVVANEAKQSRIARAALDGSAPRCLAMTELLAGHVLHYSCRRPLRIAPSARPRTGSGGRCSTSGRRYEPRSRGVLGPPPARSMTMCWMCNLAPHGCRKARIGAACSLTPSARHPPPSRCRRRR